MLTPTETELADFRTAAHAALATGEFIEYLGQRLLTGERIDAHHVDRIQTAMRPTAKALHAIFKRTGVLPTLRFRGFLFSIYLCGDIVGLTVVRESDIETVE